MSDNLTILAVPNGCTEIYKPGGLLVGTVVRPEDAQSIAHAVNSHQLLFDALEGAVNALEHGSSPQVWAAAGKAVATARLALSSAAPASPKGGE